MFCAPPPPNIESLMVPPNVKVAPRSLRQGKSLRSHGFSLLYSKRYQPSLHSWPKDRMWSKAFDSSGRRRWFSSRNRIEWTIRREDRTLPCRSLMFTGDYVQLQLGKNYHLTLLRIHDFTGEHGALIYSDKSDKHAWRSLSHESSS